MTQPAASPDEQATDPPAKEAPKPPTRLVLVRHAVTPQTGPKLSGRLPGIDLSERGVEQAEATEPLLSNQLYDTVRRASQENTEEALDGARQLLDRGFVDEARQTEADASRGITQIREGVERAAETVLGGQTDALRRARAHVEEAYRLLVERHAGELVAQELTDSQKQLGEITGEVTSDDLLGRIFGSFCIGK